MKKNIYICGTLSEFKHEYAALQKHFHWAEIAFQKNPTERWQMSIQREQLSKTLSFNLCSFCSAIPCVMQLESFCSADLCLSHWLSSSSSPSEHLSLVVLQTAAGRGERGWLNSPNYSECGLAQGNIPHQWSACLTGFLMDGAVTATLLERKQKSGFFLLLGWWKCPLRWDWPWHPRAGKRKTIPQAAEWISWFSADPCTSFTSLTSKYRAADLPVFVSSWEDI